MNFDGEKIYPYICTRFNTDGEVAQLVRASDS